MKRRMATERLTLVAANRVSLEEGLAIPEEVDVPLRLKDRTEKPTRPPGKIRAGAKEGYRHLHRK
ncbi:TPA: hypothetical protein DIV48_03190 [Candidatus Kaiserbacteria bacterium]|nr:MAG: hypothetical protein UY93_C0003G0094 [Parcubacteria group bacterium GW2011_GWA1_56_13]KKW46911.1 MAG: hypothetical protein UY97_C0002G0022 [Parcubacteria group bacterium GW2011_GWB1_57_6]HCR52618.1 hypothetical protein [Candidatus Kaiserbacteria bacterium]